jgi:hypothetical protein
MVWVGIPLLSYSCAEASFYSRIFLSIVPFIIYAAVSRISPGGDSNRNFKILRAIVFNFIVLFLFFNPMPTANSTNIHDLFSLKFKPNQGQTVDPGKVFDALEYIKSTGAKNPLIITSYNHYVFAYYSNYEVDLLWPLKKQYIDCLERDFFIIIDNKLLHEHCIIFLPGEKEACKQERTMRHFDRATKCASIDLDGVRIYRHLGEQKR